MQKDAPLHKDNVDQTEYVFNKLSFANITGAFNEDYLDVERGTGNTYREEGRTKFFHEGIDFYGNADYNIVSFILEEVLGWGGFESYGRTIFVGPSSGKGVYLLALHVDRTTIKVKDGEAVYPGMALGQTVFLSASKDKDVSHLHVSVIKLPEGIKAESPTGVIREKDNNALPTWGDFVTKDQEIWKNMVNPFNYTDPISWKGCYK